MKDRFFEFYGLLPYIYPDEFSDGDWEYEATDGLYDIIYSPSEEEYAYTQISN